MRFRTILASALLVGALAGGSAVAAQKSDNLQVAQMTMQQDGMTTSQVRMTKHQRMMWMMKKKRMMWTMKRKRMMMMMMKMKQNRMMMMKKQRMMMMRKKQMMMQKGM